MVKEGTAAPEFDLMGDDGKRHALSDFGGKYLVFYFYPKDDTPGCTIEAKDFTTHISEIRKLGAEVVGVSMDGFESHCKFRDKYSLRILLLSDPEGKIIKEYGAYGDRGIFGMGTIRSTFIIGPDGKLVKIFNKVNAMGHAEAVVSFLKGLGR